MKSKIKKLSKDVTVLGITGVGLGVAAGLGGGEAVGKIAKGVGTVGGITIAAAGMGILADATNEIQKKYKKRF